MVEIKLINNKTFEKDVNMDELKWDAMCKDMKLTVYKIHGYYHTIGGKYGNNDYWACKRGVVPSYETLVEFDGEACQWGFSVNENNYAKYKWNEHSVERNIITKIYRNGKVFYEFGSNNMDYSIAKVRKLLFEIHEHPICFSEIDYEKQIIGRKIIWNKVPCIIKSYSINHNLEIIPNLKKTTLEEFHKTLSHYDDNENYIMEDLFAESIFWFEDYLK